MCGAIRAATAATATFYPIVIVHDGISCPPFEVLLFSANRVFSTVWLTDRLGQGERNNNNNKLHRKFLRLAPLTFGTGCRVFSLSNHNKQLYASATTLLNASGAAEAPGYQIFGLLFLYGSHHSHFSSDVIAFPNLEVIYNPLVIDLVEDSRKTDCSAGHGNRRQWRRGHASHQDPLLAIGVRPEGDHPGRRAIPLSWIRHRR